MLAQQSSIQHHQSYVQRQVPTMRVQLLTGLAELVQELTELPVSALSSALNFPLESIATTEGFMPMSQISALLDECARLTGVDHLGALLARRQGPQVLGMMFLAGRNAHFLQEAIAAMVKQSAWLGHGWQCQMLQQADVALLVLPTLPKQLQLWLACHWAWVFRQLSAGRIRPNRLFVTHSSSAQASQLRQLLEVPVQYQADFNGFLCSEEQMQLALRQGDRQLFELVQHYLELTGQQPRQSRLEQIRGIMREQLVIQQQCNLTTLANALHQSPRTVQYYLQHQGLSFQQLLDETREQQAVRLLKDSELSISRIAEQLGFADISVFSRRFRVWTGQSPRQYRQHHRACR